MDTQQIQDLLLRQYNLRIGSQTADYLLENLQRDKAADVTVIGRDARTGWPLRIKIGLSGIDSSPATAAFADHLFASPES